MQQTLRGLERMIRRYEHFITRCSDDATVEQAKLLLDDCRTRYYSICFSLPNVNSSSRSLPEENQTK